jgi:hypothetical protein
MPLPPQILLLLVPSVVQAQVQEQVQVLEQEQGEALVVQGQGLPLPLVGTRLPPPAWALLAQLPLPWTASVVLWPPCPRPCTLRHPATR